MVVVLSLGLLVTEEVAPPAFRVVHLFGRPGTPHPLHFLHKIETWGKVKIKAILGILFLSPLVGLTHSST